MARTLEEYIRLAAADDLTLTTHNDINNIGNQLDATITVYY